MVYSEEPLAGIQRRKSQLFMKPGLTKDSEASYIRPRLRAPPRTADPICCSQEQLGRRLITSWPIFFFLFVRER